MLNAPRLTPNDEQATPPARGNGTAARPMPRHMGWIVAAVVFLVPTAALTIWTLTHKKDDAVVLKTSEFEEAKAKWDASGVSSYNLDLVFSGASQPKTIHVEVRDGRVTECRENGRQPRQISVWDNFTIDNQFQMIQEDLRKSAIPNGFHVKENVVITLHGEFDPEYGYPSHYLRRVARGRSPLHCQWRIEKFEPVSKDAPPAATANQAN